MINGVFKPIQFRSAWRSLQRGIRSGSYFVRKSDALDYLNGIKVKKPSTPYRSGAVFTAFPHLPSPVEKPYIGYLPGIRKEVSSRAEQIGPTQLCLEYPPLGGMQHGGAVKFKITGDISTGNEINAQLVHIRVIEADPSVSALQSLSEQTLVAKIYDPMYADDFVTWYCDPFLSTDTEYARESDAYRHLQSLQGSVIPKYYGSYTLQVPINDIGWGRHRVVRMILLEHVGGKTLKDLDPANFSVDQRQRIMEAFLRAWADVNSRGIGQGDEHPRNTMSASDYGGHAGVRLIDFGRAFRSDRRALRIANDGPNAAIRDRWTITDPIEEQGEIYNFQEWAEGWEWNKWLHEQFA